MIFVCVYLDQCVDTHFTIHSENKRCPEAAAFSRGGLA
jgi:hypothetical protein